MLPPYALSAPALPTAGSGWCSRPAYGRPRVRYNASLEEVEYGFERGLDRNQVERLAALEFVQQGKDLFITGPTGTGKSYIATALGYKACQEGFRVLYSNTARLMSLLKIAKAKGTIIAELKRIERADLLILGDFCMQPLDAQSRRILMDIIEDRHGKRSTMITSQVPVKGWHDVIGENRRMKREQSRVYPNYAPQEGGKRS